MLKNLKVPEGLILKANDKGLYNPIVFWYQMKGIRIDGFFKDKSIFDNGFSQSYTYKNLSVLKRLGLIRQENNGYQLCKYDDLFSYFGYNLRAKDSGRLGNFKIFKIKLGNFLENIALEEIRLLFSRQNYIIEKKLKEFKKRHLDTEIKLDRLNIIKKAGINLDNMISCRGLAKILGFKSPCIAHKLQVSLEKRGLLDIYRSQTNGLPNCNLLFLL